MITPETIQQITSRIDIIEVIGEFVKLKKRGANYLGNCPFHNEKTPSFTVSPSKEIYKCFGCGKSGSTISFIMEHEKLGYVEALKWLAAKYNVPVEETEVSPEFQQQRQLADSLFIINKFGQEYFTRQLFESEEGQSVALSYLKEKRGFNEETIRKFQLGYCLNTSDAFYKEAVAKQYNKDYLKLSGLVNERDGRWWDNYRERIIFPIHNNTGKIIGFGARIIKANDKAPKYINTPENELYVKSKILYGIYFARQEMDKKNECLLVEGYTDVVSLSQAGVENVVASGGTSLTQDQLRLIKKYTPNLTIIYDGDAAGIKAALRGLDMALEEGLNVQLVLIPDGEDPDSYVQKIGKDAFNEFIQNNKKDFILFRLEVSLKDAGDDSRKKSELVNSIAESIARINKAEDFTKAQDYIRKCAALLKVDEGGMTNLVNKFIRDKITKAEGRQPENTQPAFEEGQTDPAFDDSVNLLIRNELQERAVVKSLLVYGQLPFDETQKIADYIFEVLEHFHFDNTLLEKITDLYQSWYKAGIAPSDKTFLYHDDKEIAAMTVSLLEFPYELSYKWDDLLPGMNILNRDTSLQDTIDSVNYFKLRNIKKMLDENQLELENTKDIHEQMRLISIHRDLKEIEREITGVLGTVILK
ncbi:MAG: DNA primase [Chitinophagaceae bacterium]